MGKIGRVALWTLGISIIAVAVGTPFWIKQSNATWSKSVTALGILGSIVSVLALVIQQVWNIRERRLAYQEDFARLESQVSALEEQAQSAEEMSTEAESNATNLISDIKALVSKLSSTTRESTRSWGSTTRLVSTFSLLAAVALAVYWLMKLVGSVLR